MTDIVLINRYRRVRDARYLALLPALQAQISQDFAPVWGIDATLHFVGLKESVPTDSSLWKCWLLGKSDQEGDLGYHEDDTGVPEAKIFVADDLEYGAEISVTISHELLEMLADPLTTRFSAITGARGEKYVVEVGDPVESDLDGYIKNGFKMSNFVFPKYFGFDNPDGSDRYDFKDLLKDPCPDLRPGGYQLAYLNGQYTTLTARYSDGTMSYRAYKPLGRTSRIASKPFSPPTP